MKRLHLQKAQKLHTTPSRRQEVELLMPHGVRPTDGPCCVVEGMTISDLGEQHDTRGSNAPSHGSSGGSRDGPGAAGNGLAASTALPDPDGLALDGVLNSGAQL